MTSKNSKTSGIKFKHTNGKFSMEAAKELGVNLSNTNFTTTKIIYAYELGLNDKL